MAQARTARWIWRVTFGNGVPTGITQITTMSHPQTILQVPQAAKVASCAGFLERRWFRRLSLCLPPQAPLSLLAQLPRVPLFFARELNCQLQEPDALL